MDPLQASRALDALEKLESRQGISIIKLSEPISSSLPAAADATTDNNNNDKTTTAADARTSDVSNASLDATTSPASLEADLEHYRELFAKLRFSYVEQVTKEKFIRAIVGDPPLIVAADENADLERRNAAAKADLRRLKADLAVLTADLESRGRDLSRRYEAALADSRALRDLPARTEALEAEVARLRAEQGWCVQAGEGPELRMPLARTLELVAERRTRRAELDRQLEQLAAQVPRKRKEAERLRAELQPLEAKRLNSTAAAGEARKRKEAALGGAEDDLEERGRWWRASETVLTRMLEA